jgi:hypothetical protein
LGQNDGINCFDFDFCLAGFGNGLCLNDQARATEQNIALFNFSPSDNRVPRIFGRSVARHRLFFPKLADSWWATTDMNELHGENPSWPGEVDAAKLFVFLPL